VAAEGLRTFELLVTTEAHELLLRVLFSAGFRNGLLAGLAASLLRFGSRLEILVFFALRDGF